MFKHDTSNTEINYKVCITRRRIYSYTQGNALASYDSSSLDVNHNLISFLALATLSLPWHAFLKHIRINSFWWYGLTISENNLSIWCVFKHTDIHTNTFWLAWASLQHQGSVSWRQTIVTWRQFSQSSRHSTNRPSTNPVSWSVTIVIERRGEVWLHICWWW